MILAFIIGVVIGAILVLGFIVVYRMVVHDSDKSEEK